MNVLLFQLDGSAPNIALMRIAAHHRALGNDVRFRRALTAAAMQPQFDDAPDMVYASAIFKWTRPLADAVKLAWPGAIVGGTGIDERSSLEAYGISTLEQDYSLYPAFKASIDFARRGCRLKCPFCCVPQKEGTVRDVKTIADIWRGDPYPRDLVLLDNDFFAPGWEPLIDEIRSGGFRVSFNQGINARMLNDETAAAIASVQYRDDSFTRQRIYTAWDSRKDEARLFAGLEALVRHGVKPDHIMVYMLIGYWPGETHADRDYRRARLREFGARPYPMPYIRPDPAHRTRGVACRCESCEFGRELVAFQKWTVAAYDKRVAWKDWAAAGYEPRRLGSGDGATLFDARDDTVPPPAELASRNDDQGNEEA